MTTSTAALRWVHKLPLKYQTTAKQFIKFGITGTIGAIVDFSTYALITRILQWEYLYTVFEYPISTANSISVFLAIVSNFFFNKYWTFRDRQRNIAGQWTAFFSMSIVTWALNQVLMSYFTFQVPLFAQLFGEGRDFMAKVVAIIIIMFLNFFGSKFLIFRQKN